MPWVLHAIMICMNRHGSHPSVAYVALSFFLFSRNILRVNPLLIPVSLSSDPRLFSQNAEYQPAKFHVLFLFFVAAMFCISILSLFSYHLWLVGKNRSTIGKTYGHIQQISFFAFFLKMLLHWIYTRLRKRHWLFFFCFFQTKLLRIWQI